MMSVNLLPDADRSCRMELSQPGRLPSGNLIKPRIKRSTVNILDRNEKHCMRGKQSMIQSYTELSNGECLQLVKTGFLFANDGTIASAYCTCRDVLAGF